MKSISNIVQGIEVRPAFKTAPLVILAILIFAFGVFIPQLGFYQDDWHHIYFAHSLGLNRLWEMFLYDGRPMAAFLYVGGFSILGFNPFPWHLAALVLRFLTVYFTWLYLQEIWPGHRREVTWASLLFAVYPLLRSQPLSVAFTVHWVGYLLFSISIWAMIQSNQKPHRFWLFFPIALLTSAIHLAILEYYSGIELARPVIIWLLLPKNIESRKKKLLSVIKRWLPYALVLILFVIYRLYLIPLPEPGYVHNAPIVLYDLIHHPISTTITLLQVGLQDMFYILLATWENIFSPDLFKLTQPANIKIILIAALAGAALYFYLKELMPRDPDDGEESSPWYHSALLLGLALTIFGPIPAWVTGQSVYQGNHLWSGRLGMASMVGASLVIVAILELLIKDIQYRRSVLVALIAFSISWHLLYTNQYRWSWVKQSQFYHQLFWRAPYIKEDTPILSDGEILPYMGEYPTAFAISSLYPKSDQNMKTNYWFFGILRRFNDQENKLISGMALNYSKGFRQFKGSSKNSLVIYFAPENGQCLWVLSPEDATIRILPPILQRTAKISNLSRIEAEIPKGYRFPSDIFGNDPEHNWCYFYEKGSLAKQFGQWDQVVELWNAAQEKGYSPQNGVEFMPFIEGFGYTGNWEQTEKLTLRANKLTTGMKRSLCPLWEKMKEETISSPEKDQADQKVQDKLNCS